MPSPKKPAHTRVLVQVPTIVHATADARRSRERLTWSRVVTTLLSRWAVGEPLEAAIRAPRVVPGTPPPSRRGPPGEPVIIAPEKWHRSPADALLAGTGKTVPASISGSADDDEPTAEGIG